MSLLDSYSGDLQTGAVNSTVPRPQVPTEPGVFDNFASGAGRYFMRSMAETGRAIDLLGAVGPIAVDKITGGTERQDAYFREHDEVFQRAVDYWTPKPNEVGAAGQVVGQLAGGVLQFLASPALMVGTAQLTTAEDLVRQGVDSGAALVAGDVAALATVAGIALPIVGKGLASRVATGALGNVATSIPEAAIKREVVEASGKADVAAQFDPWDTRARAVDLLLGAVFGVKAHVDATAVQKDALMSLNAARHLEEVATPARAADQVELTKGVDNVRTAIEQLLRGEPVNVEPVKIESLAEFVWREDGGAVRQSRAAPDEFLQWLQAKGGVDFRDKFDITGEASGVRMNRGAVFKRGGLPIDDLSKSAEAEGWLLPGADSREFRELVRRSMSGEKVTRIDDVSDFVAEAKAEQRYQAMVQMENRLRALGVDPAPARGDPDLMGRYLEANEAKLLPFALDEAAQRQRAEVEQLLADELRPMTGEPIARPDMQAPEAKGKPRDLQTEMIQMRKTDAVLMRLLECIG